MIFLAHRNLEDLQKVVGLFLIFEIDLKYSFWRRRTIRLSLEEKFGLVDVFIALRNAGKHNFVIHVKVSLVLDFLNRLLAHSSRQENVFHRNLQMADIAVGHADSIVEFCGGIELTTILLFLLDDFRNKAL